MKVVLAPKGWIDHPHPGGGLWLNINWALGFRELGCDIAWLEVLPPGHTRAEYRRMIARLRQQLEPFDLADRLCVLSSELADTRGTFGFETYAFEEATAADLLFNFNFFLPARVVSRFRRTALLDVDPILLQNWIADGKVEVAAHDAYLTIGETVGDASRTLGLPQQWQYVAPCVHLSSWPPQNGVSSGRFTSVVHWFASAWLDAAADEKRHGFLPYLDLPGITGRSFELATDIAEDEWGDPDRAPLLEHGWSLRSAAKVAASPETYRSYVQGSLAEFSCAKPACVRLGYAWVSERTLNYLASGRPAVVEHTGKSSFLPDRAGMLRFRTVEEAATCVDLVVEDYQEQSRLARELAEHYFDARASARRALEIAL